MGVDKSVVIFLFNYYKKELTFKPIVLNNIYYTLSTGWELKFIRSKYIAGQCSAPPLKEIRISTQYIKANNVDVRDVADTLLHEFAHAIAGVHNQHNAIWSTIAQLIGSSAEVYSKTFSPYKYKMICPMGCEHYRLQLVKRIYTERKEGVATCSNHKDLPVLVINMEDNSIVKSYACDEGRNLLCQHFTQLSAG